MKAISPTLRALITLLNDGQFHTGSVLGEALNVSRNAIWKMVQQLETLGVVVESQAKKGYRLQAALDLLDADWIRQHAGLKTQDALTIYGSIASTQDAVRKQTDTAGWVFCLAEHQTQGRGRFARPWQSSFASNLLLSCGWHIAKDPSQLAGLSQVVSLSIVSALQDLGFKEPLKIKWPNDVLWQGHKLAGVLIELNGEGHHSSQVIIGIGLNINMPSHEQRAIDRPVTALNTLAGSLQNRSRIAAGVIKHLIHNLERFASSGFGPYLSTWKQYDALAGQTITLHNGRQVITGTAVGVNTLGCLLVEQEHEVKAYSAGEVTLHLGLHHDTKD